MRNIGRRSFVISAAAAVAAGMRVAGANDRINVAVVGVRGRGREHIDLFAKSPGSRVVALCDVDARETDQALAACEKSHGERPKVYRDVRKLLEDKTVD